MTRSFQLGAAAYIVKAFGYGDFRERIRTIETYLAPDRPPGRLEMASA
jgi:hypothetical protein